MWGDITPVTVPCPEHAHRVNQLQGAARAARSLQETLACFSIWAQEVSNQNSQYDAQDLEDWRDSVYCEIDKLKGALGAKDK